MGWSCANTLGGYGWMGGGSIMMVIFLLAIFALGYYLIKNFNQSKNGSSGALTILQERFAQGEITQTEYEQMKSKL